MTFDLLLGDIQPNELIPIVGMIGAVIIVPSIAILTYHQRKMAEIVRKNDGSEIVPAVLQELKSMREEMRLMQSQLNSTTIAVDDMRDQSSRPGTARDELRQRVEGS